MCNSGPLPPPTAAAGGRPSGVASWSPKSDLPNGFCSGNESESESAFRRRSNLCTDPITASVTIAVYKQSADDAMAPSGRPTDKRSTGDRLDRNYTWSEHLHRSSGSHGALLIRSRGGGESGVLVGSCLIESNSNVCAESQGEHFGDWFWNVWISTLSILRRRRPHLHAHTGKVLTKIHFTYIFKLP